MIRIRSVRRTKTAGRDSAVGPPEALEGAQATAESTTPYEVSAPEIPEDIDKVWEQLYLIFSEKHPSLAANLKNAVLKRLDDRGLEIEVSGNGFNINMIQRQKNVAIIRKVCNDFFGKKMDLQITTRHKSNDESRKKKRK